MRRTPRRTTRTLATLAVAACGLGGLAPAAALEPGTLSLTGPASVTVGSPAVMTAAGHVPSDAFLARYVYVYAIPTSVVSTCPAELTNALQLAEASSAQGGDSVAFVAVEGDFSVPIAYTAKQAGTFLLCGYLSEMSYVDARAQHVVTAAAGGSSTAPAASAPSNTQRPTVRQQGARLVCAKGSWSGSPTSYRYLWKVGSRVKAGATSRRLKVTASVRGRKVACGVTARNDAGSTTVFSRRLRAQ